MSGILIPQTTTQNGPHCVNLSNDRELGQYWEKEFCKMAAQYGKSFTPMQIGRVQSAQAYHRSKGWNSYTLPDVTIWTYPGEHHEIKHKNPTAIGMFGLEVYRYDALVWFASETRQRVMYTIHNHNLAGGRNVRENHIEHWITANIIDLFYTMSATVPGNSWVNGEKRTVDIHYWSQSLWKPLSEFWNDTFSYTNL